MTSQRANYKVLKLSFEFLVLVVVRLRYPKHSTLIGRSDAVIKQQVPKLLLDFCRDSKPFAGFHKFNT